MGMRLGELWVKWGQQPPGPMKKGTKGTKGTKGGGGKKGY